MRAEPFLARKFVVAVLAVAALVSVEVVPHYPPPNAGGGEAQIVNDTAKPAISIKSPRITFGTKRWTVLLCLDGLVHGWAVRSNIIDPPSGDSLQPIICSDINFVPLIVPICRLINGLEVRGDVLKRTEPQGWVTLNVLTFTLIASAAVDGRSEQMFAMASATFCTAWQSS